MTVTCIAITAKLAGGPEAQQFQKLFAAAAAKPEYRGILARMETFAKEYKTYLDANGHVESADKALLEKVKEGFGEKSVHGRMIAEWLGAP